VRSEPNILGPATRDLAPRARRVLIAVSLALFCVQLDFFALNLAVPSIGRGLHAGAQDAQWVLSAYMLSLGALLIAGGRLGDLLGRRRVLLVGVSVFGVASVACAVAPTLEALIAARALQGAGAAVILPGAVSVLSNTYSSDRAGKAIGMAFGLSGVGNALGPFIGGALTEAISWRWIFWINVPFVLAALVIGASNIAESRDLGTPGRIDIPGLVTVTAGLAGLSLGVNRGRIWGWGSAQTVGVLLAAAALLGLFAWIERRVRWPLVDLSLFRERRFVALAGSAAVCNAAYGVMIFGITLYLQTARGFSPLAAGVMFLGPSLAAAVAGPLSGELGARLPALTVLSLGIATGGVALLALAAVHPLGPFVAILTVSGLGFGLVYAYANVATQQAVPAAQAGEASGIVLTMLVTMAGLGVVIAGTGIQAATASGTSTAGAIRTVLALFSLLPLIAVTCLIALRRAGIVTARPPVRSD
jgi:EmrB/QacA subfamily drug resistance transporter